MPITVELIGVYFNFFILLVFLLKKVCIKRFISF